MSVTDASGGFTPRRDPNQSRNLTERITYILQAYQKYGPVCNNKFRPSSFSPDTANAEIWGSLEDVHNAIHNLTGGGGQMTNPSISAFDPIFWLHHTFVHCITYERRLDD